MPCCRNKKEARVSLGRWRGKFKDFKVKVNPHNVNVRVKYLYIKVKVNRKLGVKSVGGTRKRGSLGRWRD